MSDKIELVASFIEEEYKGRRLLVFGEDNGGFMITEKMAMKIGPIRNFLETAGAETDEAVVHEFPLKKVEQREILQKVLEYLAYHVDEPDAPAEETRAQKVEPMSDWDIQFIGNNLRTIFLLHNAADFLDINGLKHVATRKAAEYLNTCTPEQVREILGLPDDLTTEEKERIARENDLFGG